MDKHELRDKKIGISTKIAENEKVCQTFLAENTKLLQDKQIFQEFLKEKSIRNEQISKFLNKSHREFDEKTQLWQEIS